MKSSPNPLIEPKFFNLSYITSNIISKTHFLLLLNQYYFVYLSKYEKENCLENLKSHFGQKQITNSSKLKYNLARFQNAFSFNCLLIFLIFKSKTFSKRKQEFMKLKKNRSIDQCSTGFWWIGSENILSRQPLNSIITKPNQAAHKYHINTNNNFSIIRNYIHIQTVAPMYICCSHFLFNKLLNSN